MPAPGAVHRTDLLPATTRAQRVFGGVRAVVARHPAGAVAVFSAVCAVVAWLRLPPIAWDTLWAEDGRTFLQAASDHGLAHTLFVPYAGYLHAVPRLIAAGVVLLPVAWWAVAMTAASCLVAGFLAAVVFVCTRDVVRWMPARILIASLTVLAPLAPREVLGNAANLHWLFLWALFWILLHSPRTRTGAVGLGIVAMLASLTEIQALVLLPLLLIRPRERMRWIVRGGALLGLTVQVIATLLTPRAHNGNAPVPLLSVGYGWLINAVTPLGVPQVWIGPVVAWVGPAVAVAILLCLTPAVVYTLVRGTVLQRWAAASLVIGSVALYALDVETNPNSFYDYATMSHAQLLTVWLTRYGVVPSMMLAATVPLAVSAVISRRRDLGAVPEGGVERSLAFAACAVLAVLLLGQVGPQATRRSSGPEWSPQVSAAAVSCVDESPASAVVLRETIGWHVTLSCAQVPRAPDPK
ncbi:MAG: hypothetical protein ABI130_07755 [Leifsonia sp.]